jgi:phage terminase large subunit-like protein
MMAQSDKIEAGQVYLPRQAEWLDTLLLELLAFPNGRHDDQVDSVSQFLKWAALRKLLDASTLVGCGPKVFRDGIQIN